MLWGEPSAFPLPDLDRTDHLLMLGANPVASNGSLITAPDFPGRLKAMPARGGRLVVVDPRYTEPAARADEHLFIRPGTDVFWLAALVQTLFEEDLVEIEGASDPSLRRWGREGSLRVFYDLQQQIQKMAAEGKSDIEIRFLRGGRRYDLGNAERNPELSDRPSWLARKWLSFRAVPGERSDCRW